MYDKYTFERVCGLQKNTYFRDWAELKSATEGIPVVLQIFGFQLKGVGQTDLMIAPDKT